MHTFADLRNGRSDPTTWFDSGRLVRATWGDQGPCLLDLRAGPDGSVEARDHSTGAIHTMSAHPLLGDSDSGHRVLPVHRAVERAMSRFGNYRIPSSDNAYHELLPAVLGQRVTAAEALAQWRALCIRLGRQFDVDGMTFHTPPDPEALVRTPYTELHGMGIDRRRADTLREVARHARKLTHGWFADSSPRERTNSLRLIPGVGQWTSALAGYVAFGDSDALEVGDFHAKNTVAYALAGRHRGTDDEMVELLQPYAGERERVLRWLALDGWHAPAHGPRRPNLSIARL